MNESGKATLAFMLIIGIIGSFLSWMLDNGTLPARIGFPAVGIAALAGLCWAMTRKDKLPDYLRQVVGVYLERTGFCFALVPAVADGRCTLDIYFQNRYERPCRAQVVIQPSREFFLNRRSVGSFTIEIECEGGAFGVTRLPWGVPQQYQGRQQSFDVGASVSYPEGRGALLRYRDGAHVGAAKTSAWVGVMTAAAALGGIIVITKPAKVKIQLPKGVSEIVADDARIVTETLQRPGKSLEEFAT
jgi:hypothetical protein